MEMNRDLLKTEMQKRGFTDARLAREIGISKAAMSRKLAGKNEFTLSELQGIVGVLGLENPVAIFFATKVS